MTHFRAIGDFIWAWLAAGGLAQPTTLAFALGAWVVSVGVWLVAVVRSWFR